MLVSVKHAAVIAFSSVNFLDVLDKSFDGVGSHNAQETKKLVKCFVSSPQKWVSNYRHPFFQPPTPESEAR
jgi:hypothetical protein